MCEVLNISVGLLGHVDCGKTSLAKILSTTCSTACFDKNPQSQERKITLDLGFSSFKIIPITDRFSDKYTTIQVTLVDCPGHASLIKTIIGGSQIINIALLVIDITKGIETQTAECLVIAEITCNKMLIVLNKIDLIEENREIKINKTIKKLKITLAGTKFKDAKIVSVSASPNNSSEGIGIDLLKEELVSIIEPPIILNNNEPLVMAFDHCFSIKGQGTIFTGNILQGSVSVNDVIEIPCLQTTKKVKSMQSFHQNIQRAIKGDRLGLCVTKVASNLCERGFITSENYMKYVYACVVDLNLIKYYKGTIKSRSKYHISIGYDTVLAKIIIFQTESNENQEINQEKFNSYNQKIHEKNNKIDTNDESNNQENMKLNNDNKETHENNNQNIINIKKDTNNNKFNINNHYLYTEELSYEVYKENNENKNINYFAILEFDQPILCYNKNLIICSKLDSDIYSPNCRLIFYSNIQYKFIHKNYNLNIINIYKNKLKLGNIDKIISNNILLCKNLFNKKQYYIIEKIFLNFNIEIILNNNKDCLSTQQTNEKMWNNNNTIIGKIESTFGKNGKVKVIFNENINFNENILINNNSKIILKYRKYLFYKDKILQAKCLQNICNSI